jgi:hypothetical protein
MSSIRQAIWDLGIAEKVLTPRMTRSFHLSMALHQPDGHAHICVWAQGRQDNGAEHMVGVLRLSCRAALLTLH